MPDLLADPTIMSFTTPTLDQVEDSLRKLEESIQMVRTAWPGTSAETNGPVNEGVSPKSQQQLVSDLIDILRRCESLPTQALLAVESAWELLQANKLPDWDDFGRYVLDLVTKEAKAIAETASLIRRGETSGIPFRAERMLSELRASVLERAQDFLDSWPWSTGNKPGDEEDAAGTRRAMEASPPFEVLWQLAKNYPPPPGWPDEE